MTVFGDITFLAAGPASERSRSGAARSRVCKCHAYEDDLAWHVVPSTVTYPDLRRWQRRGGKLRGQRSLLPPGRAVKARADTATASPNAVGSQERGYGELM